MKKSIMLAIALCGILITTQTQATCYDSSNSATCSVNTWTESSGSYYVSENSGISVTTHTVWSGLSGYSSVAYAYDNSGTVQSVADYSNVSSYVFGSLAGTSGYVTVSASTQTSGYAYVQAIW